MKTLLIVMFVLVSILLVPLSLAYGDMLEVQNMNIYANKDSYSKGDVVHISGEIQSANGLTVSKDIPVTIVLTNDVLHKTMETLKTFPSINGNFAIAGISTTNSSWKSSGTYTVTASYGNIVNATTTFSFEIGDKNLLSPLEQSKLGIPPDKIECRSDLQPIIKKEDNSIVCVTQQTTHTLVKRGWSASIPESPIGIIGLNAEYSVGQPINATVNFTGYMNGGLYPDVKILNADNGSKVWSNCIYAHTELPSGGEIGTATYNVQCFDKYPVINEPGTYTMIASIDNNMAKTRFTVVKLSILNTTTSPENDTGIVVLRNQTSVHPTSHETPSIFPGTTILSSCGGGAVQYHTSSNILNSTGFTVYRNVMNYSYIDNDDYVIQPGHDGAITYVIDAGSSPISHIPYPIQKELNVTNYAIFYHRITDYEELLHNPSVTINGGDYKSCFKRPDGSCAGLSGPITGPINAMVVDHPGVSVSFEPASELLQYNDTAKGRSTQIITMTVHVDADSPQGTYWVVLSPEECRGGKMFLFTVGNEPFHK